MKVVVVFIIVAPVLSFQRSPCDTCSGELDDGVSYDSGHSPSSYRADDSKKHKKHSIRTNLHSSSQESSHTFLRSRRKSKKYDCECDCRQKCKNLQKCCRPVCSNECGSSSEESSESELGGGNGNNLVFVPYPYPLVVPPPPPLPIPVPLPANINITTTSAEEPRRYTIHRRQSDVRDDEILDLLQSLRQQANRRQESPRFNLRPLKEDRYQIPDYRRQIPDYEEIDDQLLDRLIMQRNVKDINSLG